MSSDHHLDWLPESSLRGKLLQLLLQHSSQNKASWVRCSNSLFVEFEKRFDNVQGCLIWEQVCWRKQLGMLPRSLPFRLPEIFARNWRRSEFQIQWCQVREHLFGHFKCFASLHGPSLTDLQDLAAKENAQLTLTVRRRHRGPAMCPKQFPSDVQCLSSVQHCWWFSLMLNTYVVLSNTARHNRSVEQRLEVLSKG